MLNSKSIGDKIATARKKSNLSQAELARQVSISPQAVGKWERSESMPDITTLNRIAEILGVDLNYFSESFQAVVAEMTVLEKSDNNSDEILKTEKKKSNWDMSKLNLTDSDFSGLKNLHEKLSSSNIQHCLFVGSEMSGLFLNSNNVENCDFTASDISNSHIQNSMLNKNVFKNCSLKSIKFSKSYIEGCDFTGADLTGAEFKNGGFGKNTIVNTKLNGTNFSEMAIQDIVFEGTLKDNRFENCSFYGVKFQNATLINTFFKNNKKFKRVQFTNCKADKLTFAFLKNNLADLTGITLIS
ncbi:MAG: transcriptional regulator [Bacteroidetes bacterium GWA2_32_17]|nr:MAG: transcriptional regulator [Bacteroidetes bacterium GWA2_32_17]